MFKVEVKKVMTADIQGLFQKFNDEFKESAQKHIDLINKFSCIKKINKEYLHDWKSKSGHVLQLQQDILGEFQKELKDFEESLELEANELEKYYKPMLEECNVQVVQNGMLDRVLRAPLEDYRQVQQYIAGKRAIMMIPSQISRNRFIMNRIAEFIDVIFSVKAEHEVI
jgi:hypothetical protein